LSPLKDHPSLRQFSINAQGLDPSEILSSLDDVLTMAPKKVAVNLCVGSHTILRLCLSARIFDAELARKLIHHGADPTFAFTRSGMRPIHYCATLEAAKFLVEELHVPVFCRRDVDALTLAIVHCSVEIVRYLIFSPAADRVLASSSCLVDPHFFLGELFNSLAITNTNPAVIDLLLEPQVEERLGVSIRGADPITGRTALHYVCSKELGNLSAVLLKRDFDVNVRDAQGMLPLEVTMDVTLRHNTDVMMDLIQRTDLSSFDIFRKLPAKAGVPRTNATNSLLIPLDCRLLLLDICLRQCPPERIKENFLILGDFSSILSELCHAPGSWHLIQDLLRRCDFSPDQLNAGVPNPVRAAAVANPEILEALVDAGASVKLQDFPHLLHAGEYLYPVLDSINLESWKFLNGPIDYSESSLCQFLETCGSTQVIVRFMRTLYHHLDELVLSKLLRSTFKHKSALQILLERPLDEFLPTAVLYLRVLAKKARVLLDTKSAIESILKGTVESPLLPILEMESSNLVFPENSSETTEAGPKKQL
jgi:ankyrin repeat protein